MGWWHVLFYWERGGFSQRLLETVPQTPIAAHKGLIRSKTFKYSIRACAILLACEAGVETSDGVATVEEKLPAHLKTMSKDHLTVQRIIGEVIDIQNAIDLLPQLALVASRRRASTSRLCITGVHRLETKKHHQMLIDGDGNDGFFLH
jgi:hypothetical protein